MKSERRHELKESELAKELSRVGVFLRDHAGTVALTVLAAAALLFLVFTLIGRARQARQVEWVELHEAAFHAHQEAPERLATLQELAEQSSQDAVAAWAHVRAGELALEMVAEGWYTLSEVERNARLQEARSAFETVVAKYDDNVRALGKARLGLARLAEYQGDRQAAVAQYDTAAALADRGARLIAAEALERRARLAVLPESVALASKPATQPAEDVATQPAEDVATQPADQAAGAPADEAPAAVEDAATQTAP